MSLRAFPLRTLTVHMLFIVLLLNGLCSSHMAMSEPPPIQYKTNPYLDPSKADYDYTAPLSPSGSNYPCKGHLNYLGTTMANSVRTYMPGGTYDLAFDGSATHASGSCQLSLSYDSGATWKVFKSFIGGCVRPDPSAPNTFKFTIPEGTPQGEALLGWTWFNNLGNREMYMNCAVVTIGGSTSGRLGKRQKQYNGPDMFIANIGNGCSTAAGTDLIFPQPGSQIEYNGNPANRANPIGTCQSKAYTPPPTTNVGSNSDPTSTGSGNGGANNGGNSGVTIYSNNGKNKPGSSTGGSNSVGSSGTLGGPATNQNSHRGDCAYWISQGYVCSEGNQIQFFIDRKLHTFLPLVIALFLNW